METKIAVKHVTTIRTMVKRTSTVKIIIWEVCNLPGNRLGNGNGNNRFDRSQSNHVRILWVRFKTDQGEGDDFLQLRRDNGATTLEGSGDRNVAKQFNRNGNFGDDGRNYSVRSVGSPSPLAT